MLGKMTYTPLSLLDIFCQPFLRDSEEFSVSKENSLVSNRAFLQFMGFCYLLLLLFFSLAILIIKSLIESFSLFSQHPQILGDFLLCLTQSHVAIQNHHKNPHPNHKDFLYSTFKFVSCDQSILYICFWMTILSQVPDIRPIYSKINVRSKRSQIHISTFFTF